MAEACGSRTQLSDSQVAANDGVAACAKFQLESIGVRDLSGQVLLQEFSAVRIDFKNHLVELEE